MKKLFVALALLGVLSSGVAASEGFADPLPYQALAQLDDSALSDVTGREGIAADLELRVNVDANGKPLASLGFCSGDNNPCRIAFNFLNRESGAVGQKGEWIVWKDYFGVTRINNLWINAGQTPSSGSGYADDRTEARGNRFMSGTGTCLLDSTKSADTCHEAARSKPFLVQEFNRGNAGGLQLFMNLGRVSTEYGPTGYNKDDRGTSLGLLIGDTRGRYQPADFKIGGRVGLFGF